MKRDFVLERAPPQYFDDKLLYVNLSYRLSSIFSGAFISVDVIFLPKFYFT